MKVKKTVTPMKLQANQKNSKKSAGPNTPTGKANVRRNALKHGLTADFVMPAMNPGLVCDGHSVGTSPAVWNAPLFF